MRLRLDELLQTLRERQQEVLAAIDADPLLLKKVSGDLVLANASKELFTPQHEHQLFAKGLVYCRAPFRLVSLPLIKIYNLGEREVTIDELHRLCDEGATQTRFLRKLDGTLVQVFRHEGRVYFTTRGMIEGARTRAVDDEGNRDFDYLSTIRALAQRKYPALLEAPDLLAGRTLILEFIHPQSRIITDYGQREGLVLLAAFDHEHFRYLPHAEIQTLGTRHGLETVEALIPVGETLAQQIEDLLRGLAGTDQEGTVLNFERDEQVVYRVKIKSPDYLRLLRAMTLCTYERTMQLLDEHPELRHYPDFEAYLKSQGNAVAPEEVLPFYRSYFETFTAYLADCERLRMWAFQMMERIQAALGKGSAEQRLQRKAFAAQATQYPHAGLIFTALDGRLDLARVRQYAPTPKEVAAALKTITADPELPS